MAKQAKNPTPDLPTALNSLLLGALPATFGGKTPPVRLTVTGESLVFDPYTVETASGSPRVDNRADMLPLNEQGTYQLTQSPAPGAKRVRLVDDTGRGVTLRDDEVIWDAHDPQAFQVETNRDLSLYSAVQVAYGVLSVYAHLRADQTLHIRLEADEETPLDAAAALVTTVFYFNQTQLAQSARGSYLDGLYQTTSEVRELRLIEVTRPAANTRQLLVKATLLMKVMRTLAEDEGTPIQRIIPTTPEQEWIDPNTGQVGIQIDF